MRSFIFLGVLGLAACAVTPPRPTVWELAGQCENTVALDMVATCTRDEISATYGPGLNNVPQVVTFLNYIGMAADSARRGEISAAQALYAISAYVSQQQQLLAAQQAEQAAQRSAALAQAGAILLQSAQQTPPPPPPIQAPVTCRTRPALYGPGTNTVCQ